MNNVELRHKMIATCQKMNAMGLNQGTSGNIGVRIEDKYLLTPSGLDYDLMEPEDIVEMDFDGGYSGNRIPSTEWRFHRDILKERPEVDVVIHTHSMFCTTLAIHGLSIPAVHYIVAAAGGTDIRCAPYVTPTTQALSDVALTALEDRRACLLAHHGMIVIGETLDSTFALLVEVENLAAQYWRALQIGKPPVLNEAQLSEVFEIMKTYGRQPDPELQKK
ncbi:MAG: class II aldolase/adducin family protein [Alphaproteobacteria bacterium]|nr:class II aldolase/adducin family protein [Alphaproteobacteria bacterium]